MCTCEIKPTTFNYFTNIRVRFDGPERADILREYVQKEREFATANDTNPVIGPMNICFQELLDGAKAESSNNECDLCGFANKPFTKEEAANFIVWLHGRFGGILKVTIVLWTIVDHPTFQQYHWYAVPGKLIGVKLMENHIPKRLPCMTDDDYVATLAEAGKTFFEAYVLYTNLLYGRESAYNEFNQILKEQ